MSSRSAWLAASLTLAVLGVAQTATAAGDPQRGAKLAYTCHGCHGIPNYQNAYPVYSVPKLGGQHAAYLVVALKAYASLERPHPTMHSHAATLTEQDMADMAAYLAGVEIKTTGKAIGAAPKASQTCVACHGNDGVGILPEYPILSGQHADYLAHSLRGLSQRPAQERGHGRHGRGAHRPGHRGAGQVLLEAATGPVQHRPGAQGREVQGALIDRRSGLTQAGQCPAFLSLEF